MLETAETAGMLATMDELLAELNRDPGTHDPTRHYRVPVMPALTSWARQTFGMGIGEGPIVFADGSLVVWGDGEWVDGWLDDLTGERVPERIGWLQSPDAWGEDDRGELGVDLYRALGKRHLYALHVSAETDSETVLYRVPGSPDAPLWIVLEECCGEDTFGIYRDLERALGDFAGAAMHRLHDLVADAREAVDRELSGARWVAEGEGAMGRGVSGSQ